VRGAVVALLLLIPFPACAETTNSQGFSFLSSFFQMIAALSIVVGLILVTRHFSGKILKGLPAGRFTSRHIRLIETRYIAPKKSLLLIEVGGEYLLLSSSGDNLSLVKQINMLEDIEVIEDEGEPRRGLLGLISRLTVK
jgi:flagellar protein FliO/FliZ